MELSEISSFDVVMGSFGELVCLMCITNGEQFMHELCRVNGDTCTEINLYPCFSLEFLDTLILMTAMMVLVPGSMRGNSSLASKSHLLLSSHYLAHKVENKYMINVNLLLHILRGRGIVDKFVESGSNFGDSITSGRFYTSYSVFDRWHLLPICFTICILW